MTARIVLSCDGHRHGQSCRGAFFARSDHRPTAIGEAWRAGWTWRPDVGDLCYSPGHDEERDRSP